jgi:hypothetical protein
LREELELLARELQTLKASVSVSDMIAVKDLQKQMNDLRGQFVNARSTGGQ